MSTPARVTMMPANGAPDLSEGNCSDVDTETFYPDGEKGRRNLAWIAEAKAVCDGCKVADLCLEIADGHGVWAGLTADERKALKRRDMRAENRARTRATNLAYDQPKGREYTTKAVLSPGLRMGRPR